MLNNQENIEQDNSYESYAEACSRLASLIKEIRSFIQHFKEAFIQDVRREEKETYVLSDRRLENISIPIEAGSVELRFDQAIKAYDEILGVQDVLAISWKNRNVRYETQSDHVTLDENSNVNLYDKGIYLRHFKGHKSHGIGAKGILYIDREEIAAYEESNKKWNEWERTVNDMQHSWRSMIAERLPSLLASIVYKEPKEVPFPKWDPQIKEMGFQDATEVIQNMAEALEIAITSLKKHSQL